MNALVPITTEYDVVHAEFEEFVRAHVPDMLEEQVFWFYRANTSQPRDYTRFQQWRAPARVIRDTLKGTTPDDPRRRFFTNEVMAVCEKSGDWRHAEQAVANFADLIGDGVDTDWVNARHKEMIYECLGRPNGFLLYDFLENLSHWPGKVNDAAHFLGDCIDKVFTGRQHIVEIGKLLRVAGQCPSIISRWDDDTLRRVMDETGDMVFGIRTQKLLPVILKHPHLFPSMTPVFFKRAMKETIASLKYTDENGNGLAGLVEYCAQRDTTLIQQVDGVDGALRKLEWRGFFSSSARENRARIKTAMRACNKQIVVGLLPAPRV